MTREELLASVWRYDTDIETNVVDVYIRYLRGKIDIPGKESYIQTVRGMGYIIRENNIKCFKSHYLKIFSKNFLWVLVILSVFNLLIYFGVTQIFLERDRYNTEQATEVVREFCLKTSLTEEKLLDLLEQYNATVHLSKKV